MIDSHAHLDDPQFDADRDAVIARAVAAGVETIVCVGTTLESSRAAVRLAERYGEIYAAVGIHPNSLPKRPRTTGTVSSPWQTIPAWWRWARRAWTATGTSPPWSCRSSIFAAISAWAANGNCR